MGRIAQVLLMRIVESRASNNRPPALGFALHFVCVGPPFRIGASLIAKQLLPDSAAPSYWKKSRGRALTASRSRARA